MLSKTSIFAFFVQFRKKFPRKSRKRTFSFQPWYNTVRYGMPWRQRLYSLDDSPPRLTEFIWTLNYTVLYKDYITLYTFEEYFCSLSCGWGEGVTTLRILERTTFLCTWLA
jgi:hypothetical protein